MKTSSALIPAGFGLLVLAAGFTALVALGASEKPHFDSQLRDGAITIDGRYDDWYGSLQPFEEAPVSIQFLNDRDFLYMRLSASAPAARREILRQGFTVWFDPGGGTKKHFGVRYPVVERGTGGAEEWRRHGSGSRPGDDRGGADETPLEPSPRDRLDVLGPGKDDARMLTRDHAQGIDVAVHQEQGTLQYELRVPLVHTADHPYAIDAVPGRVIGIGLEAGKAEHGPFGGAGPGGGAGGFGGFGGGISGGGMGGRGGGRRGGAREDHEAAKPLKGWATVTIASAPARWPARRGPRRAARASAAASSRRSSRRSATSIRRCRRAP